MTETSSSTAGPLDGLRVIDCSGLISGGFATMQLADFGADVVMVEHPDHADPIREFSPVDDGTSLWWKSLGRNKRCVTLDLSSEEGSALLLDLVEDADLFFENFRPGTLERWGLGPETLRDVNPELIVVRISGYGQTGPRAEKPGFGTVAEGISGWANANGFPDREPLLPPISLADMTAAHFAVEASMFALFEREIGGGGGSGTGQVIDVSLYESLFRQFIPDVEAYDRLDRVRERRGNRHPSTSPRNVYETADSYLTLSASSQRIFENVMRAIGQEDLIDDPRFENNDKRVENAEDLDAIIEAWTRERTTEEAIEVMEASDAIVGPVYDIEDIYEDEQYRAREDIVAVDDDLGELRTFATIPKFSRTPGEISHLGPQQGEHNEEVFLEELGLDPEEYERLRDGGVI